MNSVSEECLPSTSSGFKHEDQDSGSLSKRQRGRPAGKPQPLNALERRLRNAQYERERRIEIAEQFSSIGELLRLPENTVHSMILVQALKYIEDESQKTSLDELMRINDELVRQIQDCEARLKSPQLDTIKKEDITSSSESDSEPEEDFTEHQDYKVDQDSDQADNVRISESNSDEFILPDVNYSDDDFNLVNEAILIDNREYA